MERRTPFIILGNKSTFKEDLNCSPAELVYGQALKVPREYSVDFPSSENTSSYILIEHLRDYMSKLKISEPRYNAPKYAHVPKDLSTCKQVFVRVDESNQVHIRRMDVRSLSCTVQML